MVKDKRTFIEIQEIVQEIFTRAKLIIGYNLEFDLGFIEAKNIRLPKGVLLFDVMIEFAPIGGRWNDYRNDFKWMKLAQCARYYKYNFNAHDALEDVKATLWCFDKMLNDYEECGYRDLVNNYRNSKTWQIRIKEKKERRDIKSSFQIKDKYPYPNEYTDKLERWNKYNLSAKQYKKLIELENKQNKPIYDEITDEIYHCFLIGREWEIEQTIEESVLNDIREKCKVFGGRLFKTKAKTAKFAILKTVYDREYTTIKLLQAEGYKVTTFEEALKYMGLEDILQQEEFYKEQLEETHNKESWYKVFFNKVMGLFR